MLDNTKEYDCKYGSFAELADKPSYIYKLFFEDSNRFPGQQSGTSVRPFDFVTPGNERKFEFLVEPTPGGYVVTNVTPGGRAYLAGLMRGDICLK